MSKWTEFRDNTRVTWNALAIQYKWGITCFFLGALASWALF